MTSEGSLTAQGWIAKFADEVGESPPDEALFADLLKLAAVAAHASERPAAPIACWIAGRAGMPLDRAIAIAETIAPPKA